MCGIVGYIGKNKASEILISGLKRLEYRGYDSAGISTIENKKIITTKCKGKIVDLETKINPRIHKGSIGIGHTRWATHGEPNTKNAHPHSDSSKQFSLIHNGIIENHYAIKEYLIGKGVEFSSDTDSEVLVQLIGYLYNKEKLNFFDTVKLALKEVVGAYGILVINQDEPDKIIAARQGSPLIVGLGDGENYIGSDVSAIMEYTRNILYLDDGEMIEITKDDYKIKHIEHENEIIKEIKEIEYTLEQIEKGEFKHFMLKEIFEQPTSITNSIRGRIDDNNRVRLGGIYDWTQEIIGKKHIYFTACGTSWHAAQIGSYILESVLEKPVKVEYASEFRYRNRHLNSDSLVIAISQSGETADTLSAVKKAKECGALTLGIVNVVGSSIARETDCGIYMHAGPEIGVASTKAFTTQLVVLACLAITAAKQRGKLDAPTEAPLGQAITEVPSRCVEVLNNEKKIQNLAQEIFKARDALYLGRGTAYPIALEGALKLKEISYIHAEGYPAGEMKHGPIALIDEQVPVIVVAPKDQWFDKVVSNIQEVAARGGKVVLFSDRAGLDSAGKIAWVKICLPKVHPFVAPILYSIPVQLLAYHVAVLKGTDIDQPRNLAKSVTVE